MKRICFVIQRYGEEIVGGAESLCMQYAQELKKYYDIDVVTSCAVDYDTWENEYALGECEIEGVRVFRYPSKHPRIQERIGRLTEAVYGDPQNSDALGKRWLKEVGPYCPGMLRHIKRRKAEYALFIFVGYHYYNSTFGLPCAPEKAIFLPTAHDEPPIRNCNYFKRLFALPRAFIFLTEEERRFVRNFFGIAQNVPDIVAGSWVELAAQAEAVDIPEGGYIAYAGRIDATKNCDKLLEDFAEYRRRGGEKKLLLMGRALMELPQSGDIVYTGFVDEAKKFALLSGADAFVMPSQNESLSIGTLEAMACGTPVLVNGNCAVLRAHVERSGAGACYTDADSFCGGLAALVPEMGQRGRSYIAENYAKDEIVGRIRRLIDCFI